MADQNGKTQLVDAIARKIDGIPRSTEMFVCYLGLELVVRVCQWYILSFRLSMNIHLITLPRTHPTNKRSTFNLISRPETNPLDESYYQYQTFHHRTKSNHVLQHDHHTIIKPGVNYH